MLSDQIMGAGQDDKSPTIYHVENHISSEPRNTFYESPFAQVGIRPVVKVY
jgi:hypothetical protein